MNKIRTNFSATITLLIASVSFLPIAAVSAASTVSLPSYDRVRILQAPRDISDVTLIDQDGEPFRLSQLHGRVALVFFGFTNCPDVCPMALQGLRQLEKHGGDELADIAYVLISVDGERDTPEVMKAYLARYSPQFIGLTEQPGTVKSMAAEFKAAFFKGGSAKDGGYTVSHSPQVFVVDQVGRLRAEFYNASVEAMNGVTLALLEEAKSNADVDRSRSD